ncbi:MAG: threonylcarbamoyl-AMP synthase [Candidatus Altiarchaeales archaeon]|nr:threonylcarbamoyl-AMP synthase [Candidatus Altiarchaeales archaeon]MBD3416766.1 threonylcarbamoyl-AMP synthase [Candidatus Altiarchaeales archaeon]
MRELQVSGKQLQLQQMRIQRSLKMRALRTDPSDPDEEVVDAAVNALEKSGVIIYPTDTVYGVGCLLNEESVRRVYELKGRDFKNPLSVAFSDIEQVRHYTVLDGVSEGEILKGGWSAMSYILEKRGIPDYVTAGLRTVAVRVPESRLCRMIASRAGPIVSTSANPSGSPAPASVEEIDRSLIEGVELVLDGGRCRIGRPSKIIDLTECGRVVRD